MTGKPVKNKLVGVRPPAGGDLTRVLISAELILKSDGSLDLLICTYSGVNERKRMKDRLREARDEVGQRALESTAEPLKAKEAAEAIAEAKSTFLANTSHELRTPMNAVLGMTRLLLEEPLTSEQKDYIEIIRKGAARP